jgi:hypothetical protein
MASDDRDRTFEKALARQLRSSASSSPDANARTGASADPSAEFCPDPETLAAYHDGALSPEERNLWKQHMVSCADCQLVLAHLATPLDIPAHLASNENVLAIEQRVSSPSTASPAPVARSSPAHTLRWLWLVPAGAIAATLIAWVSLEEKKPSPLSAPPSVEVAENRQSRVAASPAKTAPAVTRERKEKDQPGASTVGGFRGASSDDEFASKESRNQLQLTQPAPSLHAATPAHGPFLSQQKQEQQIGRIAAGGAGAADLKKFDAQSSRNVAGRAAESLALEAPASPAPPPQPSEPTFLTDGAVSAPLGDKLAPTASAPAPSSASNLSASKSKAENLDAISATESVEVSAARQSPANTRAMMRTAALENPHVFWAPGGKQAWRIGPAGSLEHSKDKGLNWIPQISGVYSDLLAGSTPSAKVCWIVGASGTILRTTDGGTHWIKLDAPVTNDLTGIRATDAMHAWISFVPDLGTGLIKTYQTADGGLTWSAVPSQ